MIEKREIERKKAGRRKVLAELKLKKSQQAVGGKVEKSDKCNKRIIIKINEHNNNDIHFKIGCGGTWLC